MSFDVGQRAVVRGRLNTAPNEMHSIAETLTEETPAELSDHVLNVWDTSLLS